MSQNNDDSNLLEISFEDAIGRLEEIVRNMESAELTLEESLKLFEEGIKLAQFCTKKLDETEQRIELLLKDEDGRFVIKPFPSTEPDQE